MCARYLGFVLVVWFPGVLQAQSASHCDAPNLVQGYFIPEKVSYSNDSTLTYACNDGYKPAEEGWWVVSTCKNGKWSHEPQCIDIVACFPPDIPNAEDTANVDGWYRNGSRISIKCKDGYEPKGQIVTAICLNGEWSTLPVCDKSNNACGEPPETPHALIVQEYREVFPENSQVHYECEDGYAVGQDSTKSITCRAGEWTEGPTCKRVCYLDARRYVDNGFEARDLSGVQYLPEGERWFHCYWTDFRKAFRCTDGKISVTKCCHNHDIARGVCQFMTY